eukprot:6183742-Pleurochrysis_carterae.AAC.3
MVRRVTVQDVGLLAEAAMAELAAEDSDVDSGEGTRTGRSHFVKISFVGIGGGECLVPGVSE